MARSIRIRFVIFRVEIKTISTFSQLLPRAELPREMLWLIVAFNFTMVMVMVPTLEKPDASLKSARIHKRLLCLSTRIPVSQVQAAPFESTLLSI